jgi:hypothetical protein
MYTREEASAIRHKFWTSFGRYMSPVPSASLEKINWINYKTGIKGIFFKMDVDNERAILSVEIYLPDTVLQHQYFEVFIKFANQFEKIAGKDWVMEKDSMNENQQNFSKIYIELKKVNIFNQDNWPTIISFLKKNIMALDAFWDEYKPAFETL